MVVSVISRPLLVIKKSSPLCIKPGIQSIKIWLPLVGTISATTFQCCPQMYSVQLLWPITILPSLVKLPVAIKALQLPGALLLPLPGLAAFINDGT